MAVTADATLMSMMIGVANDEDASVSDAGYHGTLYFENSIRVASCLIA